MTKKLFSIFFYSGVILVCIVFLPSLLMPKNITIFGGKILGHWSKICLKLFLSTKIEIIGKENILNSEKFFIACTHQSAFETFYLQAIFKGPKFILKKELIKIPIFGWYLKKIGSISIKRNKISKDNLSFFDDISKVVSKSNRPIVIFPQGTRVLPTERPEFKKGVSRIYKELNISCQPIAINSGYVWPKNGSKSSDKTITISILKPISAGLDKEEFLKILENNIYSELDIIN